MSHRAPRATRLNGSPGIGPVTDIVALSGGEFDRNWFDYDILLNAVLTAGLEGALSDPIAELTVFGPNDFAFFRLARDLGFRGRESTKESTGRLEIQRFAEVAIGLEDSDGARPQRLARVRIDRDR